jgi:predicted RNase H-like nuclease (RuvC/YqgF family)
MRKSVVYSLAAIIVVLLAAGGVLLQKYRKATADYTSTKAAEEDARTRYAEAINSIAEIQDSLSAIVLGEAAVPLVPGALQAEQQLTGPQGREVLDRIAVVKASLQRTKERIRQLESQLKKNGVQIAGLQKMIANLKQTVTEKEELVGQLTSRVDSLQTQVTGLEVAVQQSEETIHAQEQTIEQKRRELGTIYYIVGSKKQLASSGVIVAKGGVLGLGKTVQPSGRFDESLFSSLDTDRENVVRTPAAKARVLSAQPLGSYEVQLVGGRAELHILDPGEFRKVKHLVIMTG